MIVPEHNLRDDVVSNIPAIRINENFTSKPSFGWGDKKELNRYLQLKKNEAYPLIWLLPTENNHKLRGKALEKNCEFIIATLENKQDLFNDQRFNKSFDIVLRPLFDFLIKHLSISGSTEIISKDWKTFDHPNYSDADKHGTIELWDAIKLTINIKFTIKC